MTITHRSRWLVAASAAVLVAGAAAAQTRVKKGFNIFSSSQDVEIGQQASAEVEKELPRLDHEGAQAFVAELGARLAAQAPGTRFPYSFTVVNVKDLNAFALPGGPIYIHRGILEAARNEGELAGVMAHEISHVALRHGTENVSKAAAAELGLGLLGGAVGGSAGSVIEKLGGFGLGAAFLKFSRSAETEADVAGSQILARSGYDPQDMAAFFDTLQADGGKRAPAFLSSHPPPDRRKERILEERQLLQVSSTAVRDTPRFQALKAALAKLPPAPTMEELKSGKAPRPTQPAPPSGGRVERPSRVYATFRVSSGLYELRHPANWSAAEDDRGVRALLAPEGGVVQVGQRNDVRHGVLLGAYRPAIAGQPRLSDAFDDFVSRIVRGSDYLRERAGARGAATVGGGSGMVTVLSGLSPETRAGERVVVVGRMLPDARLAYALLVCPEAVAADYAEVERELLASFRVRTAR